MGTALNDEVKEEVRNRVPIEDLIRDYNVNLIPAGGGRLKALCPFHHEKTPSFGVNIEKQYYHCFGCKEHGDIFTFVEKMDHVSFPEALEMLARRAGVALRRSARADPGQKMAIFDVLEMAEEYYHRILLADPRGAPARQYLERRKISTEMWKKFRLGFSLPEWEGLIRFASSKQVAVEVLEKAGLVRRRENSPGCHDYFRGRVMFPIRDAQKRVIGFGARTLGDDVPKYLNTPKTSVFDKGQVLYGLPQARAAIQREGRVAIMEGYTDAIVAHQEGLEHAVASLGTAFTLENARRLRGLAKRVDLIFDGDAAGQGAAERSLDLLVAEDLDVRIYGVTDGKDPCDALLALGGGEFRRRVETQSVGIFEFKWRRTVAQAELRGDGPAGVARALDEVLDLLGKLPNVVARKLHAKDLAERLGLDERDLIRRLDSRGGGNRSGSGTGTGTGTGTEKNDRNPSLGEVILEIFLAEPERARERWAQIALLAPLGPPEGTAALSGLPEGISLWSTEDPATARIGKVVEEQIRSGGLDLSRLRRDLEDEDSQGSLRVILARLDRAQASGGSKSRDFDWTSCLRDLIRKSLESRKSLLSQELGRWIGKDERRARELQLEIFEVQRRLKGSNMMAPAHGIPSIENARNGETQEHARDGGCALGHVASENLESGNDTEKGIAS
jgi:DNA primase